MYCTECVVKRSLSQEWNGRSDRQYVLSTYCSVTPWWCAASLLLSRNIWLHSSHGERLLEAHPCLLQHCLPLVYELIEISLVGFKFKTGFIFYLIIMRKEKKNCITLIVVDFFLNFCMMNDRFEPAITGYIGFHPYHSSYKRRYHHPKKNKN